MFNSNVLTLKCTLDSSFLSALTEAAETLEGVQKDFGKQYLSIAAKVVEKGSALKMNVPSVYLHGYHV